MTPEHLFVYGTLMPELVRRRPGRVRGLISLGPATIEGALIDLGAYPGAVGGAGDGRIIRGWVYHVPEPSLLETIDAYEGFNPGAERDSLFVRRPVDARLVHDALLPCWAYFYNRPHGGGKRIPHGDYLRWLREAGG